MSCPDCSNTGQVFAGNAEINGEVVDIYNPCACTRIPDDAEYDDPYPYPEFDVVDVDFDRRPRNH